VDPVTTYVKTVVVGQSGIVTRFGTTTIDRIGWRLLFGLIDLLWLWLLLTNVGLTTLITRWILPIGGGGTGIDFVDVILFHQELHPYPTRMMSVGMFESLFGTRRRTTALDVGGDIELV
jgi:hypothetical protein